MPPPAAALRQCRSRPSAPAAPRREGIASCSAPPFPDSGHSAPLFVFAKKGAEGTISCKTVYGQVKAPVRAGDKVGEIVVYKDNIETARTDLLAAENVDKVSYLDSIRDIADNWVI